MVDWVWHAISYPKELLNQHTMHEFLTQYHQRIIKIFTGTGRSAGFMKKIKLSCANWLLKTCWWKTSVQHNCATLCTWRAMYSLFPFWVLLARQLLKEKGTVLSNWMKQWFSLPVCRWIWCLEKSGFNRSCGQCSALDNSEINELHAPGAWCRAVETICFQSVNRLFSWWMLVGTCWHGWM